MGAASSSYELPPYHQLKILCRIITYLKYRLLQNPQVIFSNDNVLLLSSFTAKARSRSGLWEILRPVVSLGTYSTFLKGHGNEADFLGFLQKLGPHRSLTLSFELFRFWLRIRGDIFKRKMTPRYGESVSRRLSDSASRGVAVSPTRRVADSPTRRVGESMTHRLGESGSRLLNV